MEVTVAPKNGSHLIAVSNATPCFKNKVTSPEKHLTLVMVNFVMSVMANSLLTHLNQITKNSSQFIRFLTLINLLSRS